MTNTLSDRPEPVVYANLVQAVLAALVTLGWINIDSTVIDAIGTVVAAVLAGAITLGVRSQVTPVTDPQSVTGVPLVPLPPAPPLTGGTQS